MKCFQIMNNEVLIINDKKQYADTPENFVTDGGNLAAITAYTQDEEAKAVEVTPETVIYDDLQKCCVINNVWYQYPNTALESYIAALDTYIAAKEAREYVPPKTPTQQELNEEAANKSKSELHELAINAIMAILAGNDITTQQTEYQSNIMALSDDVALLIPEVYPVWGSNNVEYKVGNRVQYNGVLYKVITAHTSQGNWTPEAAPSLFAKVLTSTTGEILEWEQPSSTNPYMKGDKVRYNGKVYESLIDNNVWAPDAYPAGWKEVTETITIL